MYPHSAAPRHFSGQLLQKKLDCALGLHRVELRLQDDEGCIHAVYIAHGRGDEARDHAHTQYHLLLVGAHYYGSGTLCRQGDTLVEWAGFVTVQACHRRHRFAAQQRATVGAAA